MTDYTLTYIDICWVDHLTDRHNRDGELLLGVEVDGLTTVRQVYDDLYHSVYQGLGKASFDEERAARTIDAARHAAIQDGIADDPFDSDTIVPDDDFDERVQAWFVLSWPVEPYVRWDIFDARDPDDSGDPVHNCIVTDTERRKHLSGYLTDSYRWVETGRLEPGEAEGLSLIYRGLAHLDPAA